MIRGQHFHIIDDKGRVTMPTKLREAISEKFQNSFVLTYFEGCLLLLSNNNWRDLEKEDSGKSFFDKKSRIMRRYFVAPALDCSLDSSGRLLIPPHLREFTGIKRDVVIVGMGEVIEIWSKERFLEEMKSAEKEIGEYGESLSKLGI